MIKNLSYFLSLVPFLAYAGSITHQEVEESLHVVSDSMDPSTHMPSNALSFDKDLELPVLSQEFLEKSLCPLWFGRIVCQKPSKNSVYTREQETSMCQAEEKIKTLFSQDKLYTVGEVMQIMCAFVPSVEDHELDLFFGVLRKFRHMQDTLHVKGETWKTVNALGDFLAPELISRLMSSLREKKSGGMKTQPELLPLARWISMGYYEMGQTYGHLLSNVYKTVRSDNALEVQKHHVPSLKATLKQDYTFDMHPLGLTLDMEALALKKLKLLQKAIKIYPENLQAKYRLLEMLFHDPYSETLQHNGKTAFTDLRRHVSAPTRTLLHNFHIASAYKPGISRLIADYAAETRSGYVIQSKKPKTIAEAKKKLTAKN